MMMEIETNTKALSIIEDERRARGRCSMPSQAMDLDSDDSHDTDATDSEDWTTNRRIMTGLGLVDNHPQNNLWIIEALDKVPARTNFLSQMHTYISIRP